MLIDDPETNHALQQNGKRDACGISTSFTEYVTFKEKNIRSPCKWPNLTPLKTYLMNYFYSTAIIIREIRNEVRKHVLFLYTLRFDAYDVIIRCSEEERDRVRENLTDQ